MRVDQAPPWEGRIGGLTADEVVEFLSAPWNGRLATITPEGGPYVTPVWYEYDPADRSVYVIAREKSAYVRHIQRDPRVAFHVADDIHLSHTRVLMVGRVEILEGPVPPSQSPRIREMAGRMITRYMGDRGPEYATRTDQRPRFLLRIVPKTITTWTGGEWHPRYRRG